MADNLKIFYFNNKIYENDLIYLNKNKLTNSFQSLESIFSIE